MIDADEKVAELLPQLRAAEWVAADTEADSLHAYPEKLCLIQLSFNGTDALLDPLSSANLAPVLGILGKHELILHGADYDLRLLYRTYAFVPSAIFDTMNAARLLGCRQFSLTDLVAKYLDVRLEKGPQKANWARRPLTARMEAYARNDTRYLRPLADILKGQLKEKGRVSWLQEACARVISEATQPRAIDPERIWRVKGSHQLSPAALGVLRALWNWREGEAVAANKPPYFVMSPEAMVHLAIAAVNGRSDEAVLPRHISLRRRQGVQKAIQEGLALKDLPVQLRVRGHRQTDAEKQRLNDLEKRRNRQAEELDLDPSLLASRATLIRLANNWDAHQGELMQWQRKLLKE